MKGRYITPEERQKIKEAKAKEKDISAYVRGAVERMKGRGNKRFRSHGAFIQRISN